MKLSQSFNWYENFDVEKIGTILSAHEVVTIAINVRSFVFYRPDDTEN